MPPSSRQIPDINKLKEYFLGLKFFETLKRERDGDDFVVQQCCKELKYRKYEKGDYICKFGEEGTEFYVIMKGTVSVLVPDTVELKANLMELYEFIKQNHDYIMWDRTNKYIYEQYQLNYQQLSQYPHKQMRKVRSSVVVESNKHSYEFKVLKKVVELKEGQGFGELALLQSNKKLQKRAATIQCNDEVLVALLNKEDFENVIKQFMQKQIDTKVQYLQNFRLLQGVSKQNLEKLTYYLKEKVLRRRDCLYKEGDVVDGLYFTKEGEFEITVTHKKQMIDTSQPFSAQKFKKTSELRISILGQNQVIGLEDLNRENQNLTRNQKVTCISEKGLVFFLSKEDYFKVLARQVQKKVIIETTKLKSNFIQTRLNSLKDFADIDSTTWLKKKKRFMSQDKLDDVELSNAKKTVMNVQNEELSFLLQQHRLMKSPQLKKERVSSKDFENFDFLPERHSQKEYFLKMAELYNNLMFNFEGRNKSPGKQVEEKNNSEHSEVSSNEKQSRQMMKHRAQSDFQIKLNNRYFNQQINEEEKLSDSRPSTRHQQNIHESPLLLPQDKIQVQEASRTKSIIIHDISPRKLDKTQSSTYLSVNPNNQNASQNQSPMLKNLTISQDQQQQQQQQNSFLNKIFSYNQSSQTLKTFKPQPPKTSIKITKKLNFKEVQDGADLSLLEPPQASRQQNHISKTLKGKPSKFKRQDYCNTIYKLTLEDIKNHLMQSQKSLFNQLNQRLIEKQNSSKGGISSPMLEPTTLDLDSSARNITKFPNLIQQKSEHQINSSYGTKKPQKKANIYFNLFIRK